MQMRHNFIANALELRLFCIKPFMLSFLDRRAPHMDEKSISWSEREIIYIISLFSLLFVVIFMVLHLHRVFNMLIAPLRSGDSWLPDLLQWSQCKLGTLIDPKQAPAADLKSNLTRQHSHATSLLATLTRAPSQYKDRLIYVWRFPC